MSRHAAIIAPLAGTRLCVEPISSDWTSPLQNDAHIPLLGGGASFGLVKVIAARIHDHQQPLTIDEVDLPEPGIDEVLVHLAYAGVNPIDTYICKGRVSPDSFLPRTAGTEASGYVDDKPVVVNGSGLGTTRDGVYATAAIAPRNSVVSMPDDIDMVKAACLGVVGVTAWNVVTKTAAITKADRVLVLGAGGGVGLSIISLAQSLGATIMGQVGNVAKSAAVMAAGAHETIVASAETLADSVRSFEPTVVIDPLGGDFTTAALTALQPKGRLALFGTSAGPQGPIALQVLYRNSLQIRGYGGLGLSAEERNQSLKEAAQALQDGRMEIFIDKTVPLAQVNEAFTAIGNRTIAGKIVLDMA